MRSVSSLIIRNSMISAVLVAVAATGILLVIATPKSAADKYCEAEQPQLIYEEGKQGTKATVTVVAPSCELDLPEGTEYPLALGPSETVSGHRADLMIPVNSNGSFSHELPLDASDLPGPLTGLIEMESSGGECAGFNSCAVRQWTVLIEQQDR